MAPNTATRAAFFIVRWMLGIVFTMAGFFKVFGLGAGQHAQRFFIDAYAENWIPEWLLAALGYAIPYWELAAGLLLLMGLRVREVTVSLGLLLLITTYGHALKEPLFDITGHTFSRLALIVFLLVMMAHRDRFTLDAFLEQPDSSS